MREKLRLGLLLLAAPVLSFATQHHDEEEHVEDARTRVCRNAVADLERVHRISVLLDCWDFYWHGADPDDLMHGYDRIVQIGERIVVLQPIQNTTIYGDVAYLYWSRWNETQDDAESLPQQARYLERAESILRRGYAVPANRRNFKFLSDSGFTIYMMKKDVAHLLPLMAELFQASLAVANEGDAEERQTAVNISKQLGHYFYAIDGEKLRALGYFRNALRLQPNNPGAQRMVDRIERELGDPAP